VVDDGVVDGSGGVDGDGIASDLVPRDASRDGAAAARRLDPRRRVENAMPQTTAHMGAIDRAA